MNFSVNTILKSLFAFIVAFAGAIGAAVTTKNGDLSQVDIGSWLLALGAGATAAGALLHTPDKAATGPDKAINTVQDVVAATNQAQDDLTKKAVDSINEVLSAVGKFVPMPTVATPAAAPATQAGLQHSVPQATGLVPIPTMSPVHPFQGYPPPLGPLATRVVDQAKASKE